MSWLTLNSAKIMLNVLKMKEKLLTNTIRRRFLRLNLKNMEENNYGKI